MPEIGMSVSMSGDGKRSAGHRPQATAPILDSTVAAQCPAAACPQLVKADTASAAQLLVTHRDLPWPGAPSPPAGRSFNGAPGRSAVVDRP
jgi:hypothetical protein